MPSIPIPQEIKKASCGRLKEMLDDEDWKDYWDVIEDILQTRYDREVGREEHKYKSEGYDEPTGL